MQFSDIIDFYQYLMITQQKDIEVQKLEIV